MPEPREFCWVTQTFQYHPTPRQLARATGGAMFFGACGVLLILLPGRAAMALVGAVSIAFATIALGLTYAWAARAERLRVDRKGIWIPAYCAGPSPQFIHVDQIVGFEGHECGWSDSIFIWRRRGRWATSLELRWFQSAHEARRFESAVYRMIRLRRREKAVAES